MWVLFMKIVQKPLHLNFQKFTFMPSLQIWYTWVDLEHQVSVGISERRPQSPSSSYRCQTYAGLVLRMWISYFSLSLNSRWGNWGDHGTEPGRGVDDHQRQWTHSCYKVTSYYIPMMFLDHEPKAIKRSLKEKYRILKQWNHMKITIFRTWMPSGSSVRGMVFLCHGFGWFHIHWCQSHYRWHRHQRHLHMICGYCVLVKMIILVIMIEMIIARLWYDNQLIIVTRLIRMVKLKIDW